MTTVPKSEFIWNASKYLNEVIIKSNFIRIPTEQGNAVLVTETEWNCLMELLHEQIRK